MVKTSTEVFILLTIGSFLPVFVDPFYHVERVNFWVWLQREIWELQYGEMRTLLRSKT